MRHCGIRVRKSRWQQPIISAREVLRCQYIYPRLSSISGHGIVPCGDLADVFPDIRFFTFLREPLDRCASDYQFRRRRGGLKVTFEDWIQTPLARNHQTRQLCGREDANLAIAVLESRVGFVGLVERFHPSLVMFSRWCNDCRLDIRHRSKNVAHDSSIKHELLTNLNSRRQLIEANREDLRLYDYVLTQYFPRQEADFGPRLNSDVKAFEAFNVPRPVYPRQALSTLVREFIYKPLAPWLSDRQNTTVLRLPELSAAPCSAARCLIPWIDNFSSSHPDRAWQGL